MPQPASFPSLMFDGLEERYEVIVYTNSMATLQCIEIARAISCQSRYTDFAIEKLTVV